jgi:hypothetical protein
MLPETSYEPLIIFLEDRAVEEDDYSYSVMGILEGRISCLHTTGYNQLCLCRAVGGEHVASWGSLATLQP